jgi:type VI secretion system protein ImpL
MSSWHLNQLKYAFGLGGLMSFYGIVGMSVWIFGTKLGLPGVTDRVVIIVLILLTMPFALIIGYVSSRRSKKKELKAKAEAEGKPGEVPAAEAAPQKIAAPIGNYDDLNKSAEEVVQFLKSSNLGVNGKDAVYSLPWYVVAGTPKAGKSSLVLGSNLNFQTLPSQRQSEQKFVRPTGNIDWRVTSDAVFVDTAGRYQSEGVDGEEWSAMLETIKKHRSHRPLDGFLMVVNAEKILNSDSREIEEMAKVLRARLDNAMTRLKVRFPVYLIFTHADSIEGFRDSFSTSKNEGKTLVWGATIPLEKSESAAQMFDGEYEILHNSVMKRRLVRLSAPFPPVRQLRIFNFPLHFGSARRKLGAFVSTLFRPNPFSENPFLRGFYFTAAPTNARNGQPGNAPQTVGTTFFTERLFRDVVLRDKDLVRTFQEQRQRAPIWGWLLTGLGAALVAFLLLMAGVSLYNNKQMLTGAQEQGEKVLTIVKSDAGKNPLEKKEEEARREINATEDLREVLIKLDEYERDKPPLSMRFGMYSGDKIYKRNLLPIYFSVVEQRFKTPTVRRVEEELRKFAASASTANASQLSEQEEAALGKQYDLLKAYLMISGEYKDRAEASHISNTFKEYWLAESKIPSDLNLTAQSQLDFWANQVNRDDEDFRFPRINADAKLVADARRKLQAFPPVWRYYKRKVTEISKIVDDQIGATTTEAVLTRNGSDTSFIEGNYTVPSAYTLEGHQLMKAAIAEADEKLSEDDWVMGEMGKKEIAQSTDAGKLEERYFRDYADHWRNFVKNVTVKPYKNKEAAENALQAFSSANSPLKILLAEINRNTNLSAKPQAAGWWGWLMSFFQKSQTTPTGGGTQVEKEFRPLFAFVGTKEQAENAGIERYHGEIGKVYNRFNGVSADQMKEISQELANDKDDKLKLRAGETAITNLLKGFGESLATQELASLLQEPLGNLKELLGADRKTQIAKIWSEQILIEAKKIEKGYPFEDSQTEADLNDLKSFLNPTDGKLSEFFNNDLKKYFEESNGQWKVKETSAVKFSDEFVAYLNNAFALRKALFGTNPTPKFEYEFQLKPVADALIDVTIDGQKITSDGTASSKLSFPAGTATETGVFMNFASTAGASSTSGAALPSTPAANTSANTSAANVSTTNTSKPTPSTPAASSSDSPLKFPGNWGLFRFIDAGAPQKQPSGEYLLSYNFGGKKVSAIVKPSGGDLFDKNVFRAMKAPQNLLK